VGENSKIEWTTHTLNFWIGCQEISPACDFCYAREQNAFRGWVKGWGSHGERRRTKTWGDALRWNRTARETGIRAKVFSNSLSDFFDNAVDETGIRDEAWQVIDECRDLDWLLLTKRPQLITNRLPADWMTRGPDGWLIPWPHVWLGCTTENQEEADRRIPHLLAVPAAMHFLSCEPLLGPVDLTHILAPRDTTDDLGWTFNALDTGDYYQFRDNLSYWQSGDGPHRDNRISWVISGGESGPHARPSNPQWFRDIGRQCADAGVAWFHKQNGEYASVSEVAGPGVHFSFSDGRTVRRVGKKAAGARLDGHEHKEMPR